MLIYKHTNRINGLSYIGLTKRTMEERWQEHVNSAKLRRTNFQKAIVEYGSLNFSSEILEYCSEEQLHERERYWIKHFDTVNNGYNMKSGAGRIVYHDYPIRESKSPTETLEERILQNETLTEDKFKVTREYFELRIRQEDKIFKLSQIQTNQINSNKTKLKTIKNISMDKIHRYAVKYKKLVSVDNVDKTVNITFDDLISEFDYKCATHYENNKDIIKNYINEFFNLNICMLKIKNDIKLELKSFNRTVSSVMRVQLVFEYNIFKRNAEDFKTYQLEKEAVSRDIGEIFLEELYKIDYNRELKIIQVETARL